MALGTTGVGVLKANFLILVFYKSFSLFFGILEGLFRVLLNGRISLGVIIYLSLKSPC